MIHKDLHFDSQLISGLLFSLIVLDSDARSQSPLRDIVSCLVAIEANGMGHVQVASPAANRWSHTKTLARSIVALNTHSFQLISNTERANTLQINQLQFA